MRSKTLFLNRSRFHCSSFLSSPGCNASALSAIRSLSDKVECVEVDNTRSACSSRIDRCMFEWRAVEELDGSFDPLLRVKDLHLHRWIVARALGLDRSSPCS